MSSILILKKLSAIAAFTMGAVAVQAGTPLICHPYVIGAAQTLPGSDGDWKGVNPAYDRTHLVRDTLALLTSQTPIIVRMETLRRAAIYATAGMRGWSDKAGFNAEDRANTAALLKELQARADRAGGDTKALAQFDVGFFTETLRQTGVDRSLNGYAILLKARALRGEDPDMEFALALASSWPKQPERDQHLARARASAQPGSLLASNLETHFSGS